MVTTAIREPAHDLPVRGEYEVVVLGGGPAGIAAATAAAMHGRKVLLVERYGFLGGMGRRSRSRAASITCPTECCCRAM